MSEDELVRAVQEGFKARIDFSLEHAQSRMVAEGVPAETADDIARELAHAAGSAFQFVATAAQDAGRDLRDFLGGD